MDAEGERVELLEDGMSEFWIAAIGVAGGLGLLVWMLLSLMREERCCCFEKQGDNPGCPKHGRE